jgi:hypothetical protein
MAASTDTYAKASTRMAPSTRIDARMVKPVDCGKGTIIAE